MFRTAPYCLLAKDCGGALVPATEACTELLCGAYVLLCPHVCCPHQRTCPGVAQAEAAAGHLPPALCCLLRTPPMLCLCAVLVRYPVEGVAYFLEPGRVLSPSYFNLFLALLQMPEAAPLRDQLTNSTDRLLLLLGHPTTQHNTTQQQQQQLGDKSTATQPGAPAGSDAPQPMAIDGATAAEGSSQHQPAGAASAAGCGSNDLAGAVPAAAPASASGQGGPGDTAATPAAASSAATPAAASRPSMSQLSPADATTVAYRAAELVQLLVQQKPDWLPAQPAVFEALCGRWKVNCDAQVGHKRKQFANR